MRITLVISSLQGGGAERVAASMANYWAARGWPVTIITTGYGNQPSAYDLHPLVEHSDLSSVRLDNEAMSMEALAPLIDLINSCTQAEREVLMAEATTILKLRQAIININPEAVISFIDQTNIRVLSATRNLGVRVIVTEHCDPNHSYISRALEQLRRRLYPQASRVVALTEESLSYFSFMPGVRGRVIPNAATVPVFSDSLEPAERREGKTLLAMGRLAHEKGFDLLLGAFALAVKTHPDWSLEIWGEGPLRLWLEAYASELRLSGRVRMPGFTRRPFDVMRRADLFVLSSVCEGFPNVLLEAMACKVAVVSFDCPSGPRHIISNGVDGVLVPPRDVQAMATALTSLMGDECARRRLAAKAVNVIERFGRDKVMAMWEENLLDSAR